MTKQITTCDKCGIQKKEGNHWFKSTPINLFSLSIMPAAYATVPHTHTVDLCGSSCVSNYVAAWLQHPINEDEPKK